jgi:hypothetical protein
MAESLDLELYKALRAEASAYIEKVPALWMQKLLLAGAVVAFMLTKPASTVLASEKYLGVTAIGIIPIVAILVDAKMLEYALHARAISRFVIERFSDHETIVAWERAMWGEAASDVIKRLTRARSGMTWLATVGPTILIIIAAGAVIEHTLQNGRVTFIPVILLAIFYIVGTAWGAATVYRLGPREPGKARGRRGRRDAI